MPVSTRLARGLEHLRRRLVRLERHRHRGREAILGDEDLRTQAERDLQLAAQCMIDVASHLVAGWGLGMPEDYRGLFAALESGGGEAPDSIRREQFSWDASVRHRPHNGG